MRSRSSDAAVTTRAALGSNTRPVPKEQNHSMTLKPGTNLGELNHLPTEVWSFATASLWAGRALGLVRHRVAPTGNNHDGAQFYQTTVM
ncbi:uncharacterized protein [Oryctolagus cuniculus]|uniref:uncharacterized protein n=1 Tax=Oryctolagus cuniculus TaxID=9986 RepID=UPI0038790C50